MAEVIREVSRRFDASVVITRGGHDSEVNMANEIASLSAPAKPVVAESLSFDQLGALLQTSDLFLGIDTAPMHLAAAVGTKVVALFGPSSPDRWHPWCQDYRVVNQPCPCQANRNLTCPKSEIMKCLQDVTTGQVVEAVSDLTDW